MNLIIGGGVGEHGRNCFFVETKKENFLFDCGIMPGVSTPFPRLNGVQIQSAKWLFISHSHIDHTGAYDWLCEQGFDGCVVMTKETSRQVLFSPKNVRLINELIPALKEYFLSEDLIVTWGKSGQCAGSVWYKICVDDKSILFSGDYIEDTLVYRCDYIRNANADIAVLDSAYGKIIHSPTEYRKVLVNTVKDCIERNKIVLFPVPKYGRGFELLALFHKSFPHVPVKLDAHLHGELTRVKKYEEWIKPDFITSIKEINFSDSDESGIIFTSDPQLNTAKGHKIAEEIIIRNGAIILTGHEDIGSYSEALRLSGRAVSLRYSVHMNDSERSNLERANSFKDVISYHH
ncbi:MAG: MBL fold metallo-hydrolase [Lachnospiraceae bacterium]|jgi:Cft2 family RNA processing exonuclease|nr:MBL fold metallo-hydrolase [Lachnospiraceae bacterium]